MVPLGPPSDILLIFQKRTNEKLSAPVCISKLLGGSLVILRWRYLKLWLYFWMSIWHYKFSAYIQIVSRHDILLQTQIVPRGYTAKRMPRIHPLACQVKRRLMYSPFTTLDSVTAESGHSCSRGHNLKSHTVSALRNIAQFPRTTFTPNKRNKSLVKEERTNLDKQLFFHRAQIKIGKLQFIKNLRFWGSLVSRWILIFSVPPSSNE